MLVSHMKQLLFAEIHKYIQQKATFAWFLTL